MHSPAAVEHEHAGGAPVSRTGAASPAEAACATWWGTKRTCSRLQPRQRGGEEAGRLLGVGDPQVVPRIGQAHVRVRAWPGRGRTSRRPRRGPAGRRPASARHQRIACSGSSQAENGTGRLPCLRRLKRSSSAAATISPSTTRAADGSWKMALTPRTRMHRFYPWSSGSTSVSPGKWSLPRRKRPFDGVCPDPPSESGAHVSDDGSAAGSPLPPHGAAHGARQLPAGGGRSRAGGVRRPRSLAAHGALGPGGGPAGSRGRRAGPCGRAGRLAVRDHRPLAARGARIGASWRPSCSRRRR